MCGVVGFLNLDRSPVDGAVLRPMVARLAHRGPDGEGHAVDGELALGHRRLAIIDLSAAAAQPMASADGRWLIAYNGELYNFRELRKELEAVGIAFRSASDTEVVLNALAQWGTGALQRFNGMFAFALWDRKERRLLLGRDRYGIKPLYYACDDRRILFGSEVKALLAHPSLRAEMDREGLLEYMTFQNFFTDHTLFRHVKMLPAGCWLEVGPGHPPRIERYWDFAFDEPDKPLAEADYAEELDRLFSQAVRRQEVSDVPLGAYLSGGMDTGSITAIAAGDLPGMPSFTVGFDLSSASGLELAFDERQEAEHMSYLFKTEHYEMVLKAGDMERALPGLVRHLEEPRVGQSYPNYYAAKLAGKFVKVVLSGTGGDEIFGGYPWRYYRAAASTNFDNFIDNYYAYWQRLLPNRTIRQVFDPIWPDVAHVWTRDIFRNVFNRHAAELNRPEDYVNHSLYLEAKTFLHGLLVVEDKLSMAFGLEARVPFLDNDLVDFALRLPVSMKIGNLGDAPRLNENEVGHKSEMYFERTRDGKRLLRNVMARHIPGRIVDGPKRGFSAPDASWFRGESIHLVRRVLYESDALIYNFLDRTAVRALVDDHLEGRVNRRLLIWSLLNLEEWCQSFLEH